MATLQDIADKLGISKGTVSKAINNASDISETLRKTVLDTAVEMTRKNYALLLKIQNIRRFITSDTILSSVSARWLNLPDIRSK